jgi:hypothetical protein
VKLPDEMIELAEHILDTKAGHFDPSEFEDRYETAVVEMLKQKQAGMPPRKEAPTAPPATVVNLMAALRGEREACRREERQDRRTARRACECRQAVREDLAKGGLTEAPSGGSTYLPQLRFRGPNEERMPHHERTSAPGCQEKWPDRGIRCRSVTAGTPEALRSPPMGSREPRRLLPSTILELIWRMSE